MGKIIIKADKTFIEASPKDAEKILSAFRDDPELRFKLDDGRDEKRKKERGKKSESVEKSKPSRRERRAQEKAAKKSASDVPEKPKRKSMREDFLNWLENSPEDN